MKQHRQTSEEHSGALQYKEHLFVVERSCATLVNSFLTGNGTYFQNIFQKA
jgi:hypothetical protein